MKISIVFQYLISITILVVWFIPLLGGLMGSIRPMSEIVTGWWNLSSATFTTYNFQYTWSRIKINFLNTFAIAIPSTILPILIASLASYAFAKMRFFGRDVIFFSFVACLVIPGQIVLVPLLILLTNLGIRGTFPSIILVHTGFALPFAIFYLRNFFAKIPLDILDSARMDGASEFLIYWKILLPISKPALASLATLQFLWVWNDLLFALTFLSPERFPITVGILNLQSRYAPRWDFLCAGAVISVIPPLIVFLLLQKHFVKGIMMGAIKQ